VAAFQEPRTASELADDCGGSLPTVYRRVNLLVEYDLMREQRRIDDEGNHFRFRTDADGLTVEFGSGDISVDVSSRSDLVDRFERFWTDLGAEDGSEREGDREDDDPDGA